MAGEKQEHQNSEERNVNKAGDGNTPSSDPNAGNGQEGQGGEGATGGSADNGGGRGDLSKAVRQERQKRRDLQRELENLKRQQAAAGNQSGNGSGGGAGNNGDDDPLNMDDLAFTEDDLDDADKLNRKIAQREQRLRDLAQQGADSGDGGGDNVRGTVFDVGYEQMDNYGVFNQTDDPDLAMHAEEDTMRALSELGADWTPEKVKQIVEERSRMWERYLARGAGNSNNSQGSSQAGDNSHAGPVPGGGPGSAEAAHLEANPEPAKDFNEASKRAARRFSALQNKSGQ